MWLLLALLPLRGWAGVTMHVPAASSGQQAALVAPCHGETHAAAAVDAADKTPKACALCDLCHAAALPAASMRTGGERLAQAPPDATPRATVATEPDALFRPPRR